MGRVGEEDLVRPLPINEIDGVVARLRGVSVSGTLGRPEAVLVVALILVEAADVLRSVCPN